MRYVATHWTAHSPPTAFPTKAKQQSLYHEESLSRDSASTDTCPPSLHSLPSPEEIVDLNILISLDQTMSGRAPLPQPASTSAGNGSARAEVSLFTEQQLNQLDARTRSVSIHTAYWTLTRAKLTFAQENWSYAEHTIRAEAGSQDVRRTGEQGTPGGSHAVQRPQQSSFPAPWGPWNRHNAIDTSGVHNRLWMDLVRRDPEYSTASMAGPNVAEAFADGQFPPADEPGAMNGTSRMPQV